MTYDDWLAHNPRDDEADPAEDDREDPNPYPCDGCKDFNGDTCTEECPIVVAWENIERDRREL